MLSLPDFVNRRRRTLIAALASLLLATAMTACAGRTARVVCFVPMPPDQDVPFAVKFSREAALTGAQMIRDEGYAAIMPKAVERPSACLLLAVDENTTREDVFEQARLAGAELVAFLWIQRIETAAMEDSDEHAEWGGFVLYDEDGQELAGSRNSIEETGGAAPSVPYRRIVADGDPEGLPAVRRFARWLIGSPAEFGEQVDRLLGSK